MTKKFAKNSKKGLTLPMAIVISIVLVIVAAGLIFIALSSISTTDVSVNGRQAFMDVRSALDYAESYYRTQVTNYTKIGKQVEDPTTHKKWREEYITAAEDEVVVGTAGKRATVKYAVQDTMPNTELVKTYVVAQYFAAVGKTPPRLKLTGYSHYSDTFGNSGKMVSLSVTFTVGSSNSQKRITVINTWKDPNTQSSSGTITLHLKKPADLYWPGICYYIWTYDDVADAYKVADAAGNPKKVKYSYYDDNGNKFTPDVNKINIDEKTESVEPNSEWDGDKGPNGFMVTQGNGWSVGDYQINTNRVNYFNVIFSNQGTVLKTEGIFDSQLNEIFHLWYLNEDDKNIYFEFLNKKKYDSTANKIYYTRFRTGRDWTSEDPVSVKNDGSKDSWDGLQGLDDTILVYLRNQKTTVHFRSWQDSNDMSAADAAGIAAPVIESVSISDGTSFKGPTFLTNDGKKMEELEAASDKLSYKNKECSGTKQKTNITMKYEGCGWWVANIETKKPFNVTIKYKGMSGSMSLTNVRPYADSTAPEAVPEAWIVFKSNGNLESRMTEATALDALGVDKGSYVTIHAKNYDADVFASPVLNYMNIIEESSAGRQKLYDKILEMNMLDPLDYANYEEKFGDVGGTTGLKNKAISVYNAGVDFMKAPYKVNEAPITPAAGAKVNITEADKAYDSYVDAIDTAIRELKPSVADPQTINAFISIYDEAKAISENIVDYDSGYHDNFNNEYKKTFTDKAYDNYEQLYALVQNRNNVTITKNELSDAVESLTNVVDKRILPDNSITYGIKHQKLVRTSLETIVKKVKDSNYEDTAVYQEEYVKKMQNKLEAAEKIIEKNGTKYKNNTTKEAITTAYNELNDAIEVLKTKTVPKNNLDFTDRDTKIEKANHLIQNAEAVGENYTDKSKSELQAAIATATALTDSTTATQDDVTNAVNNIQKCMDRFTVFKPQNINDAVKAKDMVRIWLEEQDNCIYKVYTKGLTGDFQQIEGSGENAIQHESGTGFSYIDILKSANLEFRIVGVINTSGTEPAGEPKEIAAPDVVIADMTDDTIVYTIDREAETIAVKDLVTVFLGKKDADKKTINMTAFSTAGTNPTTGYGTETDYYFIRLAVEKGKSFNETLSITQTDTSSGSSGTTGVSGENRIITAPGEYVVIWTDDGTWKGYKACKVSDIYPKAVPKNTGSGDPVEPTVSRTFPSDDGYEIVPLATDLNWGAEFEAIYTSASMGANDICILFDTQNWNEFSGGKKPYIYVWKGGGGAGNQNAEYKNKPAMTHYKDTYYYYICDKSYENIIISNGSGDDGGSIKKVVDTAKIASGYRYYVLRANSLGGNGNMVWKSKTAGATTVGDNTLYDLIDISVGYGKTCIFFDTQGSGKVPYIHYWGGTDATKWGTLTQMMKFQNYNNYYYVVVNSTNKGFIISYSSSGNPKVVANDGELPLNSSGQRYKYYIVRAGTGDNYIIEPHDSAPSVVVDEPEEIDAASFVSGLKMAYVGGGRIRVKNKSYVDTYSSGVKWNSKAGDDKNKVKVEETTTIDLSGSPICIIAYRNSKDDPRIHIWKSGGDHYRKWDDRVDMNYLGESGGKHYYYVVVDGYYDHFIVTQGSSQSGDIAMNGSAVYVVNSTDVGSSVIENSGSVTSVSMPSGLSLPDMSSFEVHDSSSGTSHIEQKVKDTLTENIDKEYLYYDSENPEKSWLFGGYGGNHGSDDRVGDSKLLPYYDWYEYKIPVNQSNVYTFEVWGLDPNSTYNKTPQIKKVYGDVWVSLYNDEGQEASGKALDNKTQTIKTFSHTELSTFDPEKIMTTEKVSVYFRMPAGDATHKWQNVRVVKAHGTGDSTTSNIQQNIEMTPVYGLTDNRNTNIWKAGNISKNNPFIELAVDEVDTTSGTAIIKPHTYKIKLQGGSKKLFNPLKGLDGGWEKYQSDYEYLEDACSSLLNMYYAKTIVNQYTAKGEVVNQAIVDDTQKKSTYLLDLVEGEYSAYKGYFKEAGSSGSGTYKVSIDQSAIEASDTAADTAYANYQALKDIVQKYSKLYNKMGEAKAYMDTPLSTDYYGNDYHTHAAGASQYPEFVNRGNYKLYNQDDLKALAAKLSEAEKAFVTGTYDGASGVAAAEKAIESLDRAIANIRVGVEGTIAVVLYDAQSKVGNGYSFTISYKDNYGNEHVNEPVDQLNVEGFPIKFIYNEATEQPYDYIEEVQFSNTYTDKTTGVVHTNENIGPSQQRIEKNEVYVLMDYEKIDEEEAAFWRKNSLTDYRQMDSDQYIKDADADDVVIKMKRTEDDTAYETMTVYFKYDTLVKYGAKSYTIKAGAYDFNNGDTTEPTSVAYEGKLRLFDDRAMAYFEKSENYGMYTPGLSAVSIGWTTGSSFSTGNKVSTNGNVNLDVSKGAFTSLPASRSYSYSANGGIYFRWSSQSALEVGGGGVELHASEIRFGAVGEINVPSQYGSANTHFKFYNFEGEDTMIVHFLTDVTVKYLDSTSATHSFVIREGKYLIQKDPDAGTDYIADLFNETYWKTGVYAKPLSDGEDTSLMGGGVSGLGDKATYGN